MKNSARTLISQITANQDVLQGLNEEGYQVLLSPGVAFAVAFFEEKGGQKYKWLKRK